MIKYEETKKILQEQIEICIKNIQRIKKGDEETIYKINEKIYLCKTKSEIKSIEEEKLKIYRRDLFELEKKNILIQKNFL